MLAQIFEQSSIYASVAWFFYMHVTRRITQITFVMSHKKTTVLVHLFLCKKWYSCACYTEPAKPIYCADSMIRAQGVIKIARVCAT